MAQEEEELRLDVFKVDDPGRCFYCPREASCDMMVEGQGWRKACFNCLLKRVSKVVAGYRLEKNATATEV